MLTISHVDPGRRPRTWQLGKNLQAVQGHGVSRPIGIAGMRHGMVSRYILLQLPSLHPQQYIPTYLSRAAFLFVNCMKRKSNNYLYVYIGIGSRLGTCSHNYIIYHRMYVGFTHVPVVKSPSRRNLNGTELHFKSMTQHICKPT